MTSPTPGVFTQYSDVVQLISAGGFPNWVPAYEKDRIAAYQAYEEMYWSHSGTFAAITRGSDDDPIYVPTARIIVNTLARYSGKNLRILANPLYGTESEQKAIGLALAPLLAREAFIPRFSGSKKMALIQGDSVWHIIANSAKLPGTRVSLKKIDPAAYFPVPEEFLEEGVYRKVHIAEMTPDPDDEDKTLVERLTYTQMMTPEGGPGAIISETALFEVENSLSEADGGDKAPKLLEQILPPTPLDPRITTIPVYHFKNSLLDDGTYGNSVVRGLARLMAAINQSVSDEDLALALEGLGVYATESGAPVDAEGEDTDWWIAPGRVLENVKNFKRVEGVGSVQPFGDHIDKLTKFLFLSAGVTEAAIGNIDAATAESGIARMLKLAPTIEEARDINDAWAAGLSQMLYDLNFWLQVYESTGWGAALPLVTFADPAPVDRAAAVEEILLLVSNDPPLMSQQTALERLAELGVAMAPDELTRITAEVSTRAAQADPFADRLNLETGDPPTGA